MTLGYIKRTVDELVDRFHTTDPFELCDDLGCVVNRYPLGLYPGAGKGFFMEVEGVSVITVNCDLQEELQKVVVAHELGHSVLHADFMEAGGFHDFALYDESSHLEYEANMFASELLLSDQTVLDTLHENGSFFNAAAQLKVPAQMLDFKLHAMIQRGYKLELPLMATGDFLKDVQNQGEVLS